MIKTMRGSYLLALVASSLMLSGCLVRTAADIVTAPVRVVAKGVDLATTSQSEADEKRGREIRRREERLAKLEREYYEQAEDCQDGKNSACEDMRETYAEIQELLPTIPYEPDED